MLLLSDKFSDFQLASLALAAALFMPMSALAKTDLANRLVIAGEAGGGIDHLAIVDAESNLLWEYPTSAIHDVHLLPNGNLLFQTSWTRIVEMTLKKEIVWSYDASRMNGNEGKNVEVHAFQRLADGNTMIAESGTARIIEVDRMGRIRKEIPLKVDNPSAHSDTRRVRKLQNGHYLVSHESDGVVREYDGEGKVVWEFDVPLFGKEPKPGHGPEAFGDKTFAAIKHSNGNYLISTGNGHSVLEVTPAKEIVWKLEQNDIEGVTLGWVTSLQELANGNLVICNCHATKKNPQIIEITRDKKLVWKFSNWNHFGNNMPASLVVDDKAAVALLEELKNVGI
ncbi:MAG: PQQ-binding-like beta-propeller repeat protein [Verrucomicrobiae bacterium]|nr:PQQ-binding-like beta-propeller repeat protein [Verrucomicrobiae bacterium]